MSGQTNTSNLIKYITRVTHILTTIETIFPASQYPQQCRQLLSEIESIMTENSTLINLQTCGENVESDNVRTVTGMIKSRIHSISDILSRIFHTDNEL